MKKLFSVLLSVLIFSAICTPCIASAAFDEQTPIIYIRGNGELIYNADGEQIATGLDQIGSVEGDEGGISTDDIVESVVNILYPFLTNGLILDKWDDYGKAIYEEISPLFEEAFLDGNGDPMYGTGVNPALLAESERISHTNQGKDGWFGIYDYCFCYDWRLSPYDHVDRLHQYITDILAATGEEQVSIVCRCFGGSLLMAYLEKYGELGLVKNAMFAQVLSGGTTVISKAFSGKVEFDDKSLQRYMDQLAYCGEIGMGAGFLMPVLADKIVDSTLDLFNQVNVTNGIIGVVDGLYEKLYEALMPAICLASGMATQANYWTCVEEDDFDDAMLLMFGEEGSEAREAYSGLIDKILYYRDHVTSKQAELFDLFENEYNVHIGTIGYYGFVNAPFTEDLTIPTDALVSLTHATFGATAADVASVLSDEYIEGRIAEGYGKYISPDRQIDTSTCRFKDSTWIIKNAHHEFFIPSEKIAVDFCHGTNVTNDTPGVTARYQIADNKTLTYTEMTEDNCADFDWINKPVEKPNLVSRLAALFKWLTIIFDFIVKLFSGEISFA